MPRYVAVFDSEMEVNMIHLKDLLLVCLIWCPIGESKNLPGTEHLLRIDLPQKYENQNYNSNDDSNCFCIKKDLRLTSIPDELDGGNGLLRLVVYFYVDPVTGVMNKYVPNIEKQTLIPDLDLEPGDDLSSTGDERVSYIVPNHPNIILLKQNRKKSEEEDGYIDGDVVTESVPESFEDGNVDPSKLSDIESLSTDNVSLPQNANIEPTSFSLLNDFSTANHNTLVSNSAFTQKHQANLNHFTQWQNEGTDVNANEVSFNKWFQKQMRDVHMVSPMTANEMDISSLKKLIVNSLTEYGVVLSRDGVLRDALGKVIAFENLYLRPILIGDSVGYNHLLKFADKYSLPPDLPYLKALLVTTVYPPKVIGIIPLGMIHLSREAMLATEGMLDIQGNSTKGTNDAYLTSYDLFNMNRNRKSKCKSARCSLHTYNYTTEEIKANPFFGPPPNSNKYNNNYFRNHEQFQEMSKHQQSMKSANTHQYIETVVNDPSIKVSNEHVKQMYFPAIKENADTFPFNKSGANSVVTSVITSSDPKLDDKSFSHLRTDVDRLNPIETGRRQKTIYYQYAKGEPQYVDPFSNIDATRRYQDVIYDNAKTDPEYVDENIAVYVEPEVSKEPEGGPNLPEEELGLRIIGGHPAISSGTPISIRGRSG